VSGYAAVRQYAAVCGSVRQCAAVCGINVRQCAALPQCVFGSVAVSVGGATVCGSVCGCSARGSVRQCVCVVEGDNACSCLRQCTLCNDILRCAGVNIYLHITKSSYI
jgi:hypothetical protein